MEVGYFWKETREWIPITESLRVEETSKIIKITSEGWQEIPPSHLYLLLLSWTLWYWASPCTISGITPVQCNTAEIWNYPTKQPSSCNRNLWLNQAHIKIPKSEISSWRTQHYQTQGADLVCASSHCSVVWAHSQLDTADFPAPELKSIPCFSGK